MYIKYLAFFLVLSVCFTADAYSDYSSFSDDDSSDELLSSDFSENEEDDSFEMSSCEKQGRKQKISMKKGSKWTYCDNDREFMCHFIASLPTIKIGSSSRKCIWGCDDSTQKCVDVKPTPSPLPRVLTDWECSNPEARGGLDRWFCYKTEGAKCVKKCGVEGVESTCGYKLITTKCRIFYNNKYLVWPEGGCKAVNSFQFACGGSHSPSRSLDQYLTNPKCRKGQKGAICAGMRILPGDSTFTRKKKKKSYGIYMCDGESDSDGITLEKDCVDCRESQINGITLTCKKERGEKSTSKTKYYYRLRNKRTGKIVVFE